MTPSDFPAWLAELKTLADKATSGPWFAKATDDQDCMNARYVSTIPGPFEHDQEQSMVGPSLIQESVVAITLLQSPGLACHASEKWDEDAAFIAASREAVPTLVKLVEAQAALLAVWDSTIAECDDGLAPEEIDAIREKRAALSTLIEGLKI